MKVRKIILRSPFLLACLFSTVASAKLIKVDPNKVEVKMNTVTLYGSPRWTDANLYVEGQKVADCSPTEAYCSRLLHKLELARMTNTMIIFYANAYRVDFSKLKVATDVPANWQAAEYAAQRGMLNTTPFYPDYGALLTHEVVPGPYGSPGDMIAKIKELEDEIKRLNEKDNEQNED